MFLVQSNKQAKATSNKQTKATDKQPTGLFFLAKSSDPSLSLSTASASMKSAMATTSTGYTPLWNQIVYTKK